MFQVAGVAFGEESRPGGQLGMVRISRVLYALTRDPSLPGALPPATLHCSSSFINPLLVAMCVCVYARVRVCVCVRACAHIHTYTAYTAL